jgi:hypothetical protein
MKDQRAGKLLQLMHIKFVAGGEDRRELIIWAKKMAAPLSAAINIQQVLFFSNLNLLQVA